MQNFLLLMVAFLSGAILMALEIVGSRVLAPDFGGSIFVWGSLIGVFLAALSLGYYVGGRMADRFPRAAVLSLFLFVSGLFVLLLPYYGARICAAIADRGFGDRAGPLAASMILFFFPGGLMGATSPFVIRLTAKSLERVGNTAGVVYAVSTLGSIAGTFGMSFYLLMAIGHRKNLLLLGAALLITAFLALLANSFQKVRISPLVAIVGLFLLCAVPSPLFAGQRLLLERDSPYQQLFVTEQKPYRYLRTNSVWHSQMDLRDPQGRGFPYTDYMDIAFLFNPDIRNVLVIGLGGGTIPKRFVRDYPQVKVDAIEIDPEVIRIAALYFDFRAGKRLSLFQSDGRLFLRRSNRKYDMIVMDAYYADTVPFFLTTSEFFKIVREHLTPGGVFVNNVIGVETGPKSKFFRSLYRTTKEVFPQVHFFRVPETGAVYINLEVFALKTKERIGIESLRKRANAEGCVVKNKALVRNLLGNYISTRIQTDDVPTLTDDYAPVDALIHLW